MTRCSYCNKPINVKPTRLKKYDHSFCNRDHYFKWRRLHPVKPKKKPDRSTQKKLNKMAEKFQQTKKEEV